MRIVRRLLWVAGRDEPSATLPRRGSAERPPRLLSQPDSRRVDMASALLRRQLAHKIALPRRCLFSSTSSVLAQAAPQSQSQSTTTTTTPGGKNVFSRHIAEDLQGVTASEILAESGTRKDAQMRHFTGERIWCSFLSCRRARGSIGLTDDCSLPPPVNFGCVALAKFISCLHN